MSSNFTLLLIIVMLTSAASQTFQYSRGWTNGKRDGSRNDLQKIFSPCQMHKLRVLLKGKTLSESLLEPCRYTEDENERMNERKTFKTNNQETLYDAFQ